MQIRKALFSFISIGFILILAWLFLLIFQSILKKNSNVNIRHIPKEVTFAMRLDGKEIAERTLFSVFLETKDPAVIELFQDVVTKNFKKNGGFKNYGLDFLSDVVIFEMPFKNYTVQGFIVNVTNEHLFRKNLTKTGKIFAYKKNIGVILSNSKKNKKLSNVELQGLATKIVSNIQESSHSPFKNLQGSGKFIETYTKGSFFGESSFFGRSNILFELQENSLLLSGDISMNEKQLHTLQDIIKPNGLHISSSIIPSNVSDSLNRWLSRYEASIPPIKQFSINFKGTKIINHSSGFFIIPQMELLLSCEKPVSIYKILSTEKFHKSLDYELHANFIRFQEDTLYFKQITPTSFYIGVNEKPNFGKIKGADIFQMEGSIKPLTHIEGGGLMISFLEMLPIYRASKNLAANTDYLKLSVSKENKKSAKLSGELRFSEGHSPMNELVKFLLSGQIAK